ncbi:Uncharacterised protein [Providencia rustigianii]|uniref:Lipoprotein n=2 Tax=Providencia rustigianii TaxID=158850 RepID=D1P6V5_9GAMM|nr:MULTISPECIES: hypothetical protein [Providencia]EFB70802.1 hypothetical protein PROVRUST_07975 [Providencia rustigianii DSM 4541]SPY76434.1 Uncharacterised protein [Providencia rustigianii]SUC34396.1 Uncharacterised protein [Providencia rustigianii]VEB63585.1 Uncharacterised protein [Providencia rustigianii]
MKLLLMASLILVVAGCSNTGGKPADPPKQDPYEGSVLNTIKENQQRYKEQQARKGIY